VPVDVDNGFAKLEALLGRRADYIREPQPGNAPAVAVGRFPSVKVGLFRRFRVPVADRFVYITSGMSSVPMQIPAEEAAIYPPQVELIAYCRGAYVGAHDGQDMVSGYLQALAHMPFNTEIFFGPMHTAAVEERICPDSEMRAFFFALPDGIEMGRLCACTPAAQLVLSVMPITPSEREFAVDRGPDRLVELFAKRNVPNYFDPFRKSAV